MPLTCSPPNGGDRLKGNIYPQFTMPGRVVKNTTGAEDEKS